MNYIWYPYIEAIQTEYDMTKLCYRVCEKVFFVQLGDETVKMPAGAHQISPLLEYVPVAMHDPDKVVKQETRLSRLDVNPFFRFGKIFNNILNPERTDHNDLVVCDVITHLLAHIDRICGMSRRDFRLLLIVKEIENGCYGSDTSAFRLFSVTEKRALAEMLIMLYETTNTLRCLDNLFHMIMTDFDVRLRDDEEVEFYNPCRFDKREDEKLKFIIKLFLPVGFSYVVHWEYTYGTIGHDESMVLGRFVL
ncbi:MAG: hypothetical protein FWG42_09845 [Clostridiales bacterium]|nr:hypothetical protein [Clostridiales bacterium]